MTWGPHKYSRTLLSSYAHITCTEPPFLNKRVCPCHLPAFQNTRAQDLRTDFRNNTLLGQARSRAESAGRGRGRSVGGSAPPWSSLHSGTGQDIGWGRECICYTKTRCCLVYPQQGHFCHILIAFPSSPASSRAPHTLCVQDALHRGCRQSAPGPHLLSSICCSRSSFSAGSSEATCSSHTLRSSLEG